MSVFFVGSYTEMITPDFGGHGKGIYTVKLDEETGALEVLHTTKSVNPSYLALSDDKKFLFCINEVGEGDNPKAQSFKIEEDYSLSLVNEQAIKGSYPCHILYANKSIVVSCYGTGSVIQYKVNDLGEISPANTMFQHRGSSINKERQEAPHAHQTILLANKKDVLVADLGIDMLKGYTFSGGTLNVNVSLDFEVEKGGGPRHMVFNENGTLGYVVNELTGKVTVIKNLGDKLEFVANYESLPKSYKDTPSASAIRLHPNGNYLYVANREINTIRIFKIESSKLVFVSDCYVEGKTIREFNISGNGKWLIACLQDSDDTIVYKITGEKLIKVYHTKTILSPVCVAFIDS